MITIKKLKSVLEGLPEDAKCSAYEGEDIGINVKWVNSETGVSEYRFIRCTEKPEED
jgi:hypothetical protein